MPRTITVRDECVALELEENQLGILDRALSGHAKALEAARDMGVISHETFCGKADRARTVQFLVWEARGEVEIARQQRISQSSAEGEGRGENVEG